MGGDGQNGPKRRVLHRLGLKCVFFSFFVSFYMLTNVFHSILVLIMFKRHDECLGGQR